MITDTKIASINKDGSHKIQDRSGLYLIKRGNSKYFEGKFKKKTYPLGAWNKNVKDILESWISFKKNPTPQPIENAPKKLGELCNIFMEDVYKPKNKERTWRDRQNKINQMLNYLGEETLITEFELRNQGREKIKKMLKDLYEPNDAHDQLVRCRQFLKKIFEFAEDERFIGEFQNPVFKKFLWEGVKHQKKGSPTLAKTITSKSWGEIPKFLQSVNQNACNGSKITDLAVKAHLLLCIRSGVVARLEWDWYNTEEDMWIIPSQTAGLKRKKGDLDSDHLIPSTPEINSLMNQVREITGWQKYVFYSFNGKQDPHIGEETINDHMKNLGWKGKQSAHGWRDVITTATLEHSDISYEIIDRQLGRMPHKQGTRGHYDESTLIDKRRNFMEWWSSEIVNQGLKI